MSLRPKPDAIHLVLAGNPPAACDDRTCAHAIVAKPLAGGGMGRISLEIAEQRTPRLPARSPLVRRQLAPCARTTDLVPLRLCQAESSVVPAGLPRAHRAAPIGERRSGAYVCARRCAAHSWQGGVSVTTSTPAACPSGVFGVDRPLESWSAGWDPNVHDRVDPIMSRTTPLRPEPRCACNGLWERVLDALRDVSA